MCLIWSYCCILGGFRREESQCPCYVGSQAVVLWKLQLKSSCHGLYFTCISFLLNKPLYDSNINIYNIYTESAHKGKDYTCHARDKVCSLLTIVTLWSLQIIYYAKTERARLNYQRGKSNKNKEKRKNKMPSHCYHRHKSWQLWCMLFKISRICKDRWLNSFPLIAKAFSCTFAQFCENIWLVATKLALWLSNSLLSPDNRDCVIKTLYQNVKYL